MEERRKQDLTAEADGIIEGGLALVPGGLKDALHTDVLPDRCQGDDALAAVRALEAICPRVLSVSPFWR